MADPVTGRRGGSGDVKHIWRTRDVDLADVWVRSDSGAIATVHTTQTHLFWAGENEAWTAAAGLTPGARLRSWDAATPTVAMVRSYPGSKLMYDLTVGRSHNYYVVVGGTSVLVHNEGGCWPDLSIDSAQFGKKWGEHAKDFGLDPSDANARIAFQQRIQDTYANPEELRIGPWNPNSGGAMDYRFHRSGNLIVLAKSNGDFVTVLNADLGNGWWNGATVVKAP